MERLTQQQKQVIANRIRVLDPQGEIVVLTPNESFTGGSLVYNPDSGIIIHERINRLTDEEYVRAYLVARLVRELRYPADCLELEKTYTIGRPSPTRAQIDVKVWDKRRDRRKTFMLIEAKRPDDYDSYSRLIQDQLFATGNQEYASGVRFVVWHSLQFEDSSIRDKCIVVDFRKYHDYQEWIDAGEPGHNFELPIEYGIIRKRRYVKGETPLRTDLSRIELEALRRDFHNVLWGGAKMGDTDVFNNLLKMFLAKIYDEQTTEVGHPYRFQIDLRDGEPESPADVLSKINRLYQDALRQYFGYGDDALVAATINENRFPPNKVTYVVERLEGVSVVENTYQDDVLGVFFESIVRIGFKQEKGQFFTHSNIVRFILYALELDTWAIDLINGNPPSLPYIIDPACGSGTFLLEAMKLITQSVLHVNKHRLRSSYAARDYVDEFFLPSSPNKNAHNRWARTFVFGMDDNEDLATATKVNMILHGDGNANVLKADGLGDFGKYPLPRLKVSRVEPNAPYPFPINEQFDCLVSNPPFSLKEETRTLTEYGTRFAYAEQKNSENLFIERWYQLLKEGGRMGVVLPDSVFDTNENLYIRLYLYRYFWIRAVVSLPQVTFQPYTPTKTSLLFAVKKTRTEVEEWDAAWRAAANEYGKIRRSPVIALVLSNDRIRNALIDIATKAEVEWYPSSNILTADTLPIEVRGWLIEACTESPTLTRRLNAALAGLDEFLEDDTLNRWNTAETADARDTLKRLLRNRLPPNDETLPLPQFLEAVYDDIVQAAELNYTEDPRGQAYCNAWWVFAEVTSRKPFDYEVCFAEAEKVGYKRTTRHPEGIPQPNDLFQTDNNDNILIDTENPQKILDWLRSKQVFFCQAETLDEAAAVHVYHRYLRDAATSFGLRLTYKFLHPRFVVFNRQLREMPAVALGCLCLKPVRRGVQPTYDEDGDILVIKTLEMKDGSLDLSEAKYVSDEFFGRNRRATIQAGDILISSTGEGRGKIDLYDRVEPAMADSHVSIVSLRSDVEPLFVSHFLRTIHGKWQIQQMEMAVKGTPEIYADHIERLRILQMPEDGLRNLTANITQIESAIAAARGRLKQPTDIIDETLCEALGYPLAEYKARQRERTFSRQLSSFGAGFTLRGSVKFHHPDYGLNDAFFARVAHKRVKDYVAVPIRLGVSLTRDAMVDDGEAYYVHPGALRRQGHIDVEDCHPVTIDFYEQNRRRGALRPGDVLIARSGEGTIGKAALFELDEPCIFSDFTMRVRFDETMNSRFATYYFRSLMFQCQVEREKRGMGNMTNIFPSQVEQLLVPNCPRTQQDSLADEITAELDALQKERENIESRRKEIDALIEAAIAGQP